MCIKAQYNTYVLPSREHIWRGNGWIYRNNSLCVNSHKTQITAFYLRHREVTRSLKVSWNGVDLENTVLPKHLDVIFDMTLSYNQHVQNTKMNVTYPHNLLKKIVISKCGTNTSTTRSTVLALCYLIAEYVDPVRAWSSHADILDPNLNKALRAITGSLKPIYVEDLYLLTGIVPTNISNDVYASISQLETVWSQESTAW